MISDPYNMKKFTQSIRERGLHCGLCDLCVEKREELHAEGAEKKNTPRTQSVRERILLCGLCVEKRKEEYHAEDAEKRTRRGRRA